MIWGSKRIFSQKTLVSKTETKSKSLGKCSVSKERKLKVRARQ